MALYLGIDGGATKTECALGDEGRVLARARAAACKLQRVGREEAAATLRQAITRACTEAAVEPRAIARACLGLAGAADPAVAGWARALLAEIVPGEVEVLGDMAIALEAAFGGGPGLVVIAGTGSIAYGRNPRGETARAGGWGPAVSDEGSGTWIGRQAVAVTLRAHDAGESTPLAAAIFNAWHLAAREELVSRVNAQPPPDFAELVPQVVRIAQAGGARAREILTQSGVELAGLARIVIRRLWPGPAALQVAMAGGVFENSALVQQAFCNSLRAERPEAQVLAQKVEPVLGALARARRPASPPPGDNRSRI